MSGTELLRQHPERLCKLSVSLREELAAKRIEQVGALVLHRPRAYEDRSRLASLDRLPRAERVAFVAEVRRPRLGRPRRGGRTFLCQLVTPGAPRGSAAPLSAVWFHARPWFQRELCAGARFYFAGEVKEGKAGGPVVFNPEYEPIEAREGEEGEAARAVHFGRRVPLYPGTRHGRALRSLMDAVLREITPALPDFLPEAVRQRHGLLPLPEALRELHFPGAGATHEQLERADTEAHRRLAFDELLWVSVRLAQRRQGFRSLVGRALAAGPAAIARAIAGLPFAPTGAQARAIAEIAEDLASAHPMQRLLEGDVGSGKTAVAAVALRICVESGLQGVLMAPTELLAEQHHRSLRAMLGRAGIAVHLVTQAAGGAAGPGAAVLASGKPCVAVGTHALIQNGPGLPQLALAIVDEQHRFGVLDRLKLAAKGQHPHVLLMSATPIPRTLSLAIHGDLDLSVLDELPPGRTPVATKLLTGKSQVEALRALRAVVSTGRQAYVVYPLVEESEKIDLLDATRGVERLRAALPGVSLELVHGQMPWREREARMDAFRQGRVSVLVATTVVEVGVDVPNATLMIIANAERFGLSQLHQLRGRVGRGAEASRCLLLGRSPLSMAARKRLKAMETLTDGFRLAELDLELRGAGEILGTQQSGLPELRFADPARHLGLLAAARAEAFALVEGDPALSGLEARRVMDGLGALFGGHRSLGAAA